MGVDETLGGCLTTELKRNKWISGYADGVPHAIECARVGFDELLVFRGAQRAESEMVVVGPWLRSPDRFGSLVQDCKVGVVDE